MKMLKKTFDGSDSFYAIRDVLVDMDAKAEVSIGRWDNPARAESLSSPISEQVISIYFESWNESSMGELMPLIATLPEFDGATLMETVPAPLPPAEPFLVPEVIFDVGSAPV